MSSDDYYVVKFDGRRTGWVVLHGFASDELPTFARGNETLYPTKDDALSEAIRLSVEGRAEYGVSEDDLEDYESICYVDEYIEYATERINLHVKHLAWLSEPVEGE